MVHPLMLGSGKRLFRDGSMPTNLRLVDSVGTTTVMILRYVPAGG